VARIGGQQAGGERVPYDPTDPKEKVLQLPYKFILTLSGDEAWENIDLHDPKAVHPVVKFLQFLDQEDIQFKLEEALTNAILKGIEHWFDLVAGKLAASPAEMDYGERASADVQGTPEQSFDAPFNPPQVAELKNMPLQNKISKIVREVLFRVLKEDAEAAPDIELSEILGIIMTQADYSISDILQVIRVECGVAIIDILSASVIKGDYKFTEISIKFEPIESIKEYIIMLGRKIPRIEGVKKVRFVKLNKEV